MISVFALILLAAVSAGTEYHAWIKGDDVFVRFYDLTKIHGPFKVYASSRGIPEVGPICEACPSGVDPDYVVESGQIYQKWAPSGRYVEARFPRKAVGDMSFFYFTAVTRVPYEERLVVTGNVPNAPTKGNR